MTNRKSDPETGAAIIIGCVMMIILAAVAVLIVGGAFRLVFG